MSRGHTRGRKLSKFVPDVERPAVEPLRSMGCGPEDSSPARGVSLCEALLCRRAAGALWRRDIRLVSKVSIAWKGMEGRRGRSCVTPLDGLDRGEPMAHSKSFAFDSKPDMLKS